MLFCETNHASKSNKLIIETDCPYCDLRPTHASFQYIKTKFNVKPPEKRNLDDPTLLSKQRSEPVTIIQVAEVMHALHKETQGENALTFENFCQEIYNNTVKLFPQFEIKE